MTWDEPTFSGAVEVADKRNALRQIRFENAKRAAEEPPGTPLPFATNGQIASSAQEIARITLQRWWDDGIEKAQSEGFESLTKEEIDALKAAVIDRLDAGEAYADILTDLQS